jgi:hypothetical protein
VFGNADVLYPPSIVSGTAPGSHCRAANCGMSRGALPATSTLLALASTAGDMDAISDFYLPVSEIEEFNFLVETCCLLAHSLSNFLRARLSLLPGPTHHAFRNSLSDDKRTTTGRVTSPALPSRHI